MGKKKAAESTEPNPGIATGPLKPENRGIPLPEEKTETIEAPAPIETNEDESTDESSDETTEDTDVDETPAADES